MSNPEFFITLRDGVVAICEPGLKGREWERVRTFDEFKDFVSRHGGEIDLMCSSSIHFPEEETDDPEVIALCEEISS